MLLLIIFFLLGVDTIEEKPTSVQGFPDENSSEVDELSTSVCFSGSEIPSEANCNKGNGMLDWHVSLICPKM